MRLIILSSVVLQWLSSCGSPSSSVSGFVNPEGAVSNTPTPTDTKKVTDIKKIVTYGPSVSFNQLTGNPNDMALHPKTKLPAVAYQDDSSVISGTTALGGLKYSYMDKSGAWIVEVIDANFGTAACGAAGANCVGAANAAAGSAANVIALKFKSDGTPIVAYVFGASAATNKTVKIAERSEAGVWSISTIPYSSYASVTTSTTQDPIKSLTLTLDSSDRPHVTFAFYTNTINNSTLVYSSRDTQGNWTTVNPNGGGIWTNGTAGLAAGMNQSGSVICPIDNSFITTGSIPTAAAASVSRVYKCDLAATGSCTSTNWTQRDYPAQFSMTANPALIANGGGRTFVNLTSTNHVLLSTTDGANGLKFAVSTETCDTALASMNFTAATTQLSVASSGASGYRPVVAGSLVHVFYTTGTASVHFAKAKEDLSAGGFNVGDRVLAETVAVGNEGVSGAYDATNDVLYGSYGAVPAGTLGIVGNDIRVAFGTTADVASSATLMTISNIDQVNRVFANNSIPNVSASKAPNGTVGFTYFFQDFLPTNPAQTSKIYYGVKAGTESAPLFTSNIVANHVGAATTLYTGQYSSLAYDSNSNPVIAYHDLGTVSGGGFLQVSRSSNGGLSFSSEQVDGLTTAVTVGQFPSAAVTTNDVLGVAYQDYTPANMRLKFARKKINGGWLKYNIDGLSGTAGTNGCSGSIDSGKFAVLKFTSKGMPVIAYQANLVSQRSLRIAYATEDTSSATYTWYCTTVDVSSNNRGEGIDMVLDSSDRPHIAHYDLSQGAVRYTTCATDIAACVTKGTTAFTSERVAVTGAITSGASKPTIQVTAAGKIFVAYHQYADTALELSSKGATDTAWTKEQIDTPSVTGAGFFALNGMNAAMVLNANDSPMIFYRSFENWLKYFSRELL